MENNLTREQVDNLEILEENVQGSIKRIARYYNVNYYTVLNIMRETGYGPEGAVELAIEREDEKWFYLKGKMYENVETACKDCGYDLDIIKEVAARQNLKLSEALQLYSYLLASKSRKL
jgi:hypothetical protein